VVRVMMRMMIDWIVSKEKMEKEVQSSGGLQALRTVSDIAWSLIKVQLYETNQRHASDSSHGYTLFTGLSRIVAILCRSSSVRSAEAALVAAVMVIDI
jgi:hypothetical protein